MVNALLTALHYIAGTGAVVCWALGMYFWYLQGYGSTPGVVQRRRMVFAFVLMGALFIAALGLRMANDTLLGT